VRDGPSPSAFSCLQPRSIWSRRLKRCANLSSGWVANLLFITACIAHSFPPPVFAHLVPPPIIQEAGASLTVDEDPLRHRRLFSRTTTFTPPFMTSWSGRFSWQLAGSEVRGSRLKPSDISCAAFVSLSLGLGAGTAPLTPKLSGVPRGWFHLIPLSFHRTTLPPLAHGWQYLPVSRRSPYSRFHIPFSFAINFAGLCGVLPEPQAPLPFRRTELSCPGPSSMGYSEPQ